MPALKQRAARPTSLVMRVPRLVLLTGVAAVLSAGLALLGLREFLFTDYDVEARPAFDALAAGDLAGFLSLLPAYAGGVLLRAPFALAADAAGGGQLAVYRAVAVPGILALAAVAVVLAQRLPGRAGWGALVLLAANPLVLDALEIGHPEELLGAALCTGAVLAALAGHPLLAGVLLGLAVSNKAWALLAVGPVVLALRSGRTGALLLAGAVVVVVSAPVLLAAGAAPRPAPVTGGIFQPWQVWWFLGDHGSEVIGTFGAEKPGYRSAPAWLSPIPRPLIILLAVPLSLAAARVRGRHAEDALLLLALLLLLRCVLDPWNTAYYALPGIVALAAFAVVRGAAPWGALAMTVLAWVTLTVLPSWITPDLQAVSYLAWALPATAILSYRLYRPAAARATALRLGARAAQLMPTLARLRAADVSGRPSAPSAGR